MVAFAGKATRKGRAALERPLVLGAQPARARVPWWAYIIGLIVGILTVEGLGIHFVVIGVIDGLFGGASERDDPASSASSTSTGREQRLARAHGDL